MRMSDPRPPPAASSPATFNAGDGTAKHANTMRADPPTMHAPVASTALRFAHSGVTRRAAKANAKETIPIAPSNKK